jgi:hypothetical protein
MAASLGRKRQEGESLGSPFAVQSAIKKALRKI